MTILTRAFTASQATETTNKVIEERKKRTLKAIYKDIKYMCSKGKREYTFQHNYLVKYRAIDLAEDIKEQLEKDGYECKLKTDGYGIFMTKQLYITWK